MPVKKYIRFIGAWVATVILTAAGTNNTPPLARWVLTKNCTVRVNGSTNINKFSCSIPCYANPDTITCYKNNARDLPVTMQGRMVLPVNSFDCLNSIMTNDLRKTLKAKEYPSLYIDFLSLERFPQLQPGQESITGAVNIELAGVAKKIIVNYTIYMDEQKIIHLTGNQHIFFSDFHLSPPKKLGGMIRTEDKLEVTFTINCKMITQ